MVEQIDLRRSDAIQTGLYCLDGHNRADYCKFWSLSLAFFGSTVAEKVPNATQVD